MPEPGGLFDQRPIVIKKLTVVLRGEAEATRIEREKAEKKSATKR